jgi:hypothetical protein
MNRLACLALLLSASLPAVAQQVADRDFAPAIAAPAHAIGKGPVVCLDEAHHNFHTLDGRFHAFGALLRRDGYVVVPNRKAFDARSLSGCAVLVIANAQPSDADWDTYPVPTPSAFLPAEIAAVHAWVEGGGRLLLIADHMPLAGAAKALAAAFDVAFTDGFAFADGDDAAKSAPTLFRSGDGTLADHPIVRGTGKADAITQVRSFTGQAFQAPGAQPLMVLPAGFVSLHPPEAWAFAADTPKVAVGGWLQGAVKPVGRGRAAFFGEAAMFSAQLAGPQRAPMGMNAPGAEQNARFALNVMHWLEGAPAAAE